MILAYSDFLQDQVFLQELSEHRAAEYLVEIAALDFETEVPVGTLRGLITGGTMSVAANTPTRRTGSLSAVFDSKVYDLTNIDNLISIDKKIFLKIGIKNPLTHVAEYAKYGEELYFKQGVFIITQASSQLATNSASVSISFIDKMGMLNGTCGGTLPASVNFHDRITVDADGNVETSYPLISEIIREVVQFFGGEDPARIIIDDLPTFGQRVVSFAGKQPIRFSGSGGFVISNRPIPGYDDVYYRGDNIGYMATELTYPGELVQKAGSTVAQVLDEIVKTLGNYEYFYDTEGFFHFQQIKNFDKTGEAPWDGGRGSGEIPPLNLEPQEDAVFQGSYLPRYSEDQFLNQFLNADQVTQISHQPQYVNIKNDFIVWGSRKEGNVDKMVRYHLAIDERPKEDLQNSLSYRYIFEIRTPDNMIDGYIFTKGDGDSNFLLNGVSGSPETPYWSAVGGNISSIGSISYKTVLRETVGGSRTGRTARPFSPPITHSNWGHKTGATHDLNFQWREELYRKGLAAYGSSTRGSYYDEELLAEWRDIYDPWNKDFYRDWLNHFGETVKWQGYAIDVVTKPQRLRYWLDIIDTNTALGAYSVKRIGRRSIVQENNKINEVISKAVPDIVFIDATEGWDKTQEVIAEMAAIGQKYSVVQSNMLPYFEYESSFGSCYEEVRELFYRHLILNASINFSCKPVFYLDVNKVVRLNFPEAGVVGNYVINSFSWNLGQQETMSISANEAVVII